MREKQLAQKMQPRYDGLNRDKNLPHKDGNVIRFKMPIQGKTSFEDKILGTISVDNKELDDFIILRGDGSPTYNFSAAIDDHAMKITTVVRGDDHITNTLKQINIFNSLEEPIPTYAHLPMVLSNTGKRLSKRDGAVDLLDYKKLGYLKEALINYLVKLGWTHSDQEIFSKEELLSLFTLEAVNSSPAKFSEDLLNFYNNHYINSIQVEDLYQLINKEYDVPYKIDSNIHYLEILNLLREGSKTILDLISQMQFFYEVPQYEEKYKDSVQANIEIISVFKENINALDFSDLSGSRLTDGSAFSNGIEAFVCGGYPAVNETYEVIKISSTGSSIAGDKTRSGNQWPGAGCSNSTRALFAGGETPSNSDVIDFVTIATLGNAEDFGDLTAARNTSSATSSPTRGVFAGGSPGPTDTIDKVEILTTGNAVDFGNLGRGASRTYGAFSNGHGGLG